MSDWHSTVSSILPTNQTTIALVQDIASLSLWQYGILVVLTRIGAVTLISTFILYITMRMKSSILAILLTAATIFTPMLLNAAGSSVFNLLTVDRLLMANTLYYSSKGFSVLLIPYIISLLLIYRIIRQSNS